MQINVCLKKASVRIERSYPEGSWLSIRHPGAQGGRKSSYWLVAKAGALLTESSSLTMKRGGTNKRRHEFVVPPTFFIFRPVQTSVFL